MTIKDFKDFQKLLKLCRQGGVQHIKVDNIELHLSESEILLPPRTYKTMQDLAPEVFPPGSPSANDKIQTPDELTKEQLLYWSTGEIPGEHEA